MSTSKPDPKSIDWDAGLRELLVEHGIDPDRNAPMTKAQRRRRYLRKARGTIVATVAAVVASWVIANSGAPAAVFIPLMAWFLAWLGRGYWKAAGSPTLRQMAEATGEHGQRALLLVIRWIGRTLWYPIARAIRIRFRARRLAVVR